MLEKKVTVLIIGKVEYYLHFSISGELSKLLPNEPVDNNLTGSDVNRFYGGMAANIAYGLYLLGSHSILVSQVGNDFDWFYRPHMENIGIELRLFIDPERETACQYQIKDNQETTLNIQQDNSYRFFAERSIEDQLKPEEFQILDAVFIGTGKVEADTKFISVVYEQNKRLPIIYSPDSNVQELTKWKLSQIFDRISVLICTEAELRLIEERMKKSCSEILASSKRLKYIISMMYRSKTVIYSKESKIKVSEGPADDVLSDDSWQDAFRAGIVYGVAKKKPINEAAKLGSSLASYAVESRENQQYSPSLEQITLRAFEVKVSMKKN